MTWHPGNGETRFLALDGITRGIVYLCIPGEWHGAVTGPPGIVYRGPSRDEACAEVERVARETAR